MITEKTTLCGSIAGRASKLGPIMHNAAYEALGLDFIYMAFSVSNPKDAIAGMRALGIRGLGVSMPHKQEVMRFLDEIDQTASAIGAVNTIVNENGKLKGYNSDWIGAIRALEERISIERKRVVLVGAGGVARAIAYGLKSKDVKVNVYNRTLHKAEQLAKEFKLELGGTLEDLHSNLDYDILINATSVGSHPSVDKSPIYGDVLKPGKVVMDVVFYPLMTKLIREAQDAGCVTIPGYRMLIHQALFQFEAYTGRTPPFEVMESALRQALES